jgi:lysyl-tRNA synthetase class I
MNASFIADTEYKRPRNTASSKLRMKRKKVERMRRWLEKFRAMTRYWRKLEEEHRKHHLEMEQRLERLGRSDMSGLWQGMG